MGDEDAVLQNEEDVVASLDVGLEEHLVVFQFEPGQLADVRLRFQALNGL